MSSLICLPGVVSANPQLRQYGQFSNFHNKLKASRQDIRFTYFIKVAISVICLSFGLHVYWDIRICIKVKWCIILNTKENFFTRSSDGEKDIIF
jgi:hypothetical protein